MRSSLLFLLLLVSACADGTLATRGAMEDNAGDLASLDLESAEQLLIVGIDTDLRTALYLVDGLDADGVGVSRAVDASSYRVTELASLEAGSPTSPVSDDAENAFSPTLPYPVPDMQGSRVALLATWSDADGLPAGRVRVLDVATGGGPTTGDIAGLREARFFADGAWLALQTDDPDTGRPQVGFLPTESFLPSDSPWVPAEWAEASMTWAAAQGESALVIARQPGSDGAVVLRVTPQWDPPAATVETLWSVQGWSANEAVSNPEGSAVAVTALSLETGRTDVFVVGETVIGPLGGNGGVDCGSPAWNPTPQPGRELVLVCVDPESGRPDLVITDGEASWDAVTQVAQPEVPEGTMDLLVIVGRPQWSPDGELLVFGAVPREDSYQGAGATLLALPVSSGRAWPVVPAGDGSIDWVHFSRTTSGAELVFWDRSAADLSGSGGQGIQLVSIDEEDADTVPVVLDRPLLVSYPMFLSQNSLFYP